MSELSQYDKAINALLAYDEARDPTRAGLLRDLFASQRIFYHALQQAVVENSQGMERLAERVQTHISPQLLNIQETQEQARKVQGQILTRLGAQDAIQQATHDNVLDIARMLHHRQRSIGDSDDPEERL